MNFILQTVSTAPSKPGVVSPPKSMDHPKLFLGKKKKEEEGSMFP